MPPFSEMEVMAKVSEGLHQRTWLLEECKLKNLPVRVASALINPVNTTVPVRLLNLSSDTTTAFKGTKVATAEECDCTHHQSDECEYCSREDSKGV